jgi:hypothetical protein
MDIDDVTVTRSDIAALPDAIAGSSLPARDLLYAIASALQAAAGEDESVTLGVDLVESSLPDTFEAAFEPDPAPTHGTHQILLRMKITR